MVVTCAVFSSLHVILEIILANEKCKFSGGGVNEPILSLLNFEFLTLHILKDIWYFGLKFLGKGIVLCPFNIQERHFSKLIRE